MNERNQLIFKADKAITADPDARRCDRDREHGKLFPNGDGDMLQCGKCNFRVVLDPRAFEF